MSLMRSTVSATTALVEPSDSRSTIVPMLVARLPTMSLTKP